MLVTTSESAEVEVEVVKGKDKTRKTETWSLEDLVDVKGWKAMGNKLNYYKIIEIEVPKQEYQQQEDR